MAGWVRQVASVLVGDDWWYHVLLSIATSSAGSTYIIYARDDECKFQELTDCLHLSGVRCPEDASVDALKYTFSGPAAVVVAFSTRDPQGLVLVFHLVVWVNGYLRDGNQGPGFFL